MDIFENGTWIYACCLASSLHLTISISLTNSPSLQSSSGDILTEQTGVPSENTDFFPKQGSTNFEIEQAYILTSYTSILVVLSSIMESPPLSAGCVKLWPRGDTVGALRDHYQQYSNIQIPPSPPHNPGQIKIAAPTSAPSPDKMNYGYIFWDCLPLSN